MSEPVVRKTGHAAGSRKPPRRGVISIRWIVTSVAVALTAGAVLSVNFVAERNTREALEREVEGRLLLEARNLALASSEALLTDFPELTLHPLLKEMRDRGPELGVLLVVDNKGTIQGDPDVRGLGSKYSPDASLVPVSSQQPLIEGETLTADRELILVSVPVMHRNGKRMGTALVGLKRNYLEGLLTAARRQQTFVMVAFLIAGIALSFTLMSSLLKPIKALREGIERIGRGNLDDPLKLKDRTELGLLADAVNEMASELKRAQAEMVERERLAHEVELARQIQGSLLPSQRLVAGDFVIAGSQRAAAEVGGDYYDFFKMQDGKVAVAVADVSGKGLAGCLVMSMLHALLRALKDAYPRPSSLLAALDAQLGETLQPGTFVTMFFGILDPQTGVMTYSSAGHNPSLVYRSSNDTIEWLKSRGIPLGAVRGGAIVGTLEDAKVTLADGDLLLQFTDGISEAFDPSGEEQFGFKRMENAVMFSATRGCARVIESMHRSVKEFAGDKAPDDDETVLVVSREGDRASRIKDDEPVKVDPLACLAEAKLVGKRLRLPATLDGLVTINDWLAGCLTDPPLSETQFDLLGTALYEAAANVVEHGYGEDPQKELEMWWVPGQGDKANPLRIKARESAADPTDVLRNGYFLIRDHGKAFAADNWKGIDFNDPEVRMRGRGIGLGIIFSAMSHVSYYPATKMGNVTLMAYIPEPREEAEERRSA